MTLEEIRTNAATVIKMIEEQSWGMSEEDKNDWYRSMALLVAVEQTEALKRIADGLEKLERNSFYGRK